MVINFVFCGKFARILPVTSLSNNRECLIFASPEDIKGAFPIKSDECCVSPSDQEWAIQLRISDFIICATKREEDELMTLSVTTMSSTETQEPARSTTSYCRHVSNRRLRRLQSINCSELEMTPTGVKTFNDTVVVVNDDDGYLDDLDSGRRQCRPCSSTAATSLANNKNHHRRLCRSWSAPASSTIDGSVDIKYYLDLFAPLIDELAMQRKEMKSNSTASKSSSVTTTRLPTTSAAVATVEQSTPELFVPQADPLSSLASAVERRAFLCARNVNSFCRNRFLCLALAWLLLSVPFSGISSTMAAPIQHARSGDPFGSSSSSALSSASSSSSSSSYSGRGAKWINPCRVPDANVVGDGAGYDKIPESASDSDIVKQILDPARAAYSYADTFKLQYALETFNLDFQALHEMYKDHFYSWLPTKDEIPKELGEETPAEHLESLEFDETLKRLYEYFQRYSVGLEQMLLDLSIYGGSHLENFKMLENIVGSILCELQIAMLEKGVRQNPDVTRNIMTEELRDIENDLQRNLRDWTIFRDLLNALEYTEQVMVHFTAQFDEN